MSMVINTNIASINSQRHINTAVREQSEAMERLSSGKRINSSKDDAAGLGIANRMTSQIRGLDQAVRNANDGISLIQIAEGALDQTTNVLQRMRELSIQSANGTYNNGENRQALDAEFQQLLQEIDRIAESTTFNGNILLDGTMEDVSLQIGADAYQTADFGIGDMSSKSLGMGSIATDVLGSEIKLTAHSTTIGYNDININGQSIVKPGEDEITSGDNKDKLVNAINNNINGVTATLVGVHEIHKTSNGALSGDNEVVVKLTMADGTEQTYEVRDATSYDDLANKLNTLSNGAFEATNGELKFSITAEGVASISVDDGSQAIGAVTSGSTNARLSLTSDDGDPIAIERGSTGKYEDLIDLGFQETTTPGVVEGFGISSSSTPWSNGDLTINGASVIEATTSSSLIQKVDAINELTSQTGVKAETYVSAELDMSTFDFTAGAAGMVINGTTITAASSNSALVDAINAKKDTTGIMATLSGETIQLDGNASSLQVSATSPNTGLTAATLEYVQVDSAASTTMLTSATNIYGGLKLSSKDGNPISIEIGSAASSDRIGLMNANSFVEGRYGTSVNGLSIETAAQSQKSIGVIDRAINTVSMQRGELGAINNRLEHAIDSMMNVSQQTSAARSRITDADFAKESAALSRAQVLQQAGTAMLSQANAAPNQVLQLLQG